MPDVLQLPSGSYATLAAKTSQNSGGLRQTQKIAVGVSVGVGALILAAIVLGIYALLRRRRRRQAIARRLSEKHKLELDSMPVHQRVEMGPPDRYLGGQNRPYTYELHSDMPPQELDSTGRAHML
jgi:nitroreductase